MRAISTLVFSLFFSVFCSAQSINGWILLDVSSNKGEKNYIKQTYEKKSGRIIKIWTKQELKSATIEKKLYLNVKILSLEEFDCTENKKRLLAMVYYDSKGNVIQNFEWEDYESQYKSVIPDSVGEGVLQEVCIRF